MAVPFMTENAIEQVRPTSTFESFQLQVSEQQPVVDGFRRLAQSLVDKQDVITGQKYPFNHARLILLWGAPGRGKTHLLEATVNHVRENAPSVIQKIHFSRSNFTERNMVFPAFYDEKPIVFLDDMFAQHHNISALHPSTDIRAIINLVMGMYERRRLVIASCNFPLKGEILEKVKRVDETGRVTSRLAELLATSGEMELVGPDYRQVLAEQMKSADPFTL